MNEFKTESDAQKAVDALRLTINEQTPRQQLKEISFETLVQHYRQHEMPDIFYKKTELPQEIAEDENRKSYATQDTYEGYLKKWILPRWKSYRLRDIKSVQVEQWLKTLRLAPGSRAKIRNIMSAVSQGQHPQADKQLVQHRMAHEYKNENGRTVKAMEHRAGWDATFSAPKSVSLTALVGGDQRIREAHRDSVRIALNELEQYTQARIGGNHPAETTGKFALTPVTSPAL